jgi:predicted DNA-binding transcriptional regulator
MVISTTAENKMVDDVEQKLMAEVDQIEKEFKRGLKKLNDKLTMMNCENLCTSDKVLF